MDADLALLHEKIDRLTEQVEDQRSQQTAQITGNNGDELAHLHKKIDFISDQMELQAKRAQAMDELKDDVIPIANHLIKLSINELAEIGNEFQSEDLLFLLKRLLRDTHLLLDMLDRLEAVMGLVPGLAAVNKPFPSMVPILPLTDHDTTASSTGSPPVS